MSTSLVPLPILTRLDSRPLRISPTDISQFVRLEQCERYLRFRLAERDGQKFMRAYDVTPQRVTPLLTLSGLEFERLVEAQIGEAARFVHFAPKEAEEVDRTENNAEVVEEARRLAVGETVVLFQPRLQVELDGWLVGGDVDRRGEDQAIDEMARLVGDVLDGVDVEPRGFLLLGGGGDLGPDGVSDRGAVDGGEQGSGPCEAGGIRGDGHRVGPVTVGPFKDSSGWLSPPRRSRRAVRPSSARWQVDRGTMIVQAIVDAGSRIIPA